jgi:hypothetical protein
VRSNSLLRDEVLRPLSRRNREVIAGCLAVRSSIKAACIQCRASSTSLMKRSARVTALALNLHKPGLMQELIVALSGVKNDVSLLTAAREAVAQSWPR